MVGKLPLQEQNVGQIDHGVDDDQVLKQHRAAAEPVSADEFPRVRQPLLIPVKIVSVDSTLSKKRVDKLSIGRGCVAGISVLGNEASHLIFTSRVGNGEFP